MKALDLFCKQGGATRGLQLAGYHVTGVDIESQPRYCGDRFIRGDALTVALDGYDLIWASPPCQEYTNAQKIRNNDHPDLIAPIRARLIASDTPYIIENVPGAPLINPIMLMGSMFGLGTMRPRLFECSFDVPFFLMPTPAQRTAKMGRRPMVGEYMHVVGNFSDVAAARTAMGIDWMTRDGLREAIPPAYSQFLAEQLRR